MAYDAQHVHGPYYPTLPRERCETPVCDKRHREPDIIVVWTIAFLVLAGIVLMLAARAYKRRLDRRRERRQQAKRDREQEALTKFFES